MRKFSALALAGLLAAGATLMGVTTSSAAVKANAACTKAGAKSGTGKNQLICMQSPLTNTPKLIWASANCVAANKTYVDAVKKRDDLTASFTNAVQKINAAITINQNYAATWSAKVTKYTNDLNAYLAKNPNGDPKSVASLRSSIRALQIQADSANKRVATLQSQLTDTQSSQGSLVKSATDNVSQLKTQLTVICKSGL
jgi:hypothetical protein